MIWSKDLFNPGEKKSSHHSLQSKNHKDRMLLNSNSKNRQKRKLDQNHNDDKCATSYEIIDTMKHGGEIVQERRRHPTLGLSCPSPRDGKRIIIQGLQKYDFPPQNGREEFCGISAQDYSHLSDFNDSIKGSGYLMNQVNLDIHVKDLMDDNSYYCSPKTPIKKKPKKEDMDIIHSPKTFLASRGNHLPRPVIPIGPRFQAEVPKWETKTNVNKSCNDDCLKWLGTQIWPMSSLSKTNAKGIDEGRLDSCSSDNPESVDCIQKHIGEARECLKFKSGTVFSSWKFDDMGEDVSKSWTMEEQKEFESLVKLNPQSSGTKLCNLAMKYFPSKSMKSIINYYYNVYIPRCMSIDRRSFFGAVDRKPN